MNLKAELEEIADPLYLPTGEGIKGRITVGDRTTELDNALREPYAQRTRLFATPMATPRKYILTQCSTIPARGKALEYEDFRFVPTETAEKKAAATEGGVTMCGRTEDIHITCKESVVGTDMSPIGQEDKKKEGIAQPERRPMDKEPASEEGPTAGATDPDSTFLVSLKRQGRFVQAHFDRALAVFGQDYATPSEYAARGSQQFEDVLRQQDQIAAEFFAVDRPEQRQVTARVRESFLRFFLVVFARYKFFFDADTRRLDEERFVASLNLPPRQREYVREAVTSQMFDIFLHGTQSIQHRTLFDEYVVKRATSSFGRGGNGASHRRYGTPLLDSSQWQNPTVVVPEQICRVGLKEGRTYCHDRKFPDTLDPDECITNQSVSFWRSESVV